ncbi:MAG: sigma-70 family RNA polymerase sigma factor [Candidatus Gastranaerophilales bacterium]|nr:sigma-70 family RNA polymerase sigma factor [Candidatus Gastranaerophilales bacterium]
MEDYATIEEITSWIQEYKTTQNSKIKSQLRNLIVLAYLPFVKKISHGLARRNTDPVEDLVQVGSVGLLKAIDQYNNNLGASFRTYATYLITGEIRHYLRDKASMIRAPRELQELSFRINQIIQVLTIKLDRIPTDDEIAIELEIPVNRVAEVTEIDRRKYMVSLDQVVSGSNDTEQSLIDRLVDNKYLDYQIAQEDRIMLLEAIEKLNDTLKEVVKLSFFHDMSQNEISKQLGISQMQVSRRLKKAITELFGIITLKKLF